MFWFFPFNFCHEQSESSRIPWVLLSYKYFDFWSKVDTCSKYIRKFVSLTVYRYWYWRTDENWNKGTKQKKVQIFAYKFFKKKSQFRHMKHSYLVNGFCILFVYQDAFHKDAPWPVYTKETILQVHSEGIWHWMPGIKSSPQRMSDLIWPYSHI